MKKLILPLLLILGITMLVAVESAPSEVVGYVKYDCVVGNNLIAMPMVQAFTTTTEFGAQFGEDINTINIYDPIAQDWMASINYGGGFWDPELPVATGSVMLVNATSPVTYYSIGDLPAVNAQYSVIAGNNTVMIPLNRSDLASTALAGASMSDGETVNTINVYDSAVQDWMASINYGGGFWDPELTLSIGTPMLINSGSAFDWPAGPRNVRMSNSK